MTCPALLIMRPRPCFLFVALLWLAGNVLISAEAVRRSATVALITNAEGAHVSAYLSSLAGSPDVAAVVVADPSGRQVAAAKKALGTKFAGAYDSAEGLLAKHRPDLALVSLEPGLAPAAIDLALEAGCHVLAEKPAVLSAERFRALARKADAKGRHLMLALANRSRPEIRFAREWIAGGGLGRVYGVEVHMIADQTRLGRPGYAENWFAQKARAGGGHLIWLGIHWVDLAMLVTGSDITHVAGFVANVGGKPFDVEDSATLSLRFANGSLGTLTSGYYLDKGYHSHLKVWGSQGWLEINLHGGETPVRYYTTTEANPAVRSFVNDQPDGGYAPFVASAVRAALGLEPPPITTAESERVLKTLFTAYRAAESGRAQAVP